MVPDLSRILSLATLLSDPQLDVPVDPRHRHEREGDRRPRGGRARVRARADDRALHLAPPGVGHASGSRCAASTSREEEFAEEYEHLLPYLLLVDSQGEDQVTYFEALTALAYLWFADKPVALGVFEVGMGGTWDATNLVRWRRRRPHADRARPSGARLHRRRGRARRRRASSRRASVAISPRAGRRGAARDRGAVRGGRRGAEARVPRLRGRGAAAGDGRTVARGCAGVRATYDDLFLPMFGEHAARNAAAAVAAVESLLGQAARRGRRRARRSPHVRWPGRMEIVARHPTDRARRRAQPGRRRGARRRAPRVLHLGPAAPGDLGIGEQGRRAGSSGRSRRSPMSPTRQRTPANAAATPLVDRRGVRRAGQAGGDVRLGRRRRSTRRAQPPTRPTSSS